MKNVILYTRVSTHEQTEGFSLETQYEDLKEECKNRKYNIINTYTDAGKSGTSIETREKYREMLEYIERFPDKIDAILIWKFSRIGRSVKDLSALVSFLEENNISLISIKDNIDTSMAGGKMTAYILGAISEMERNNIVTTAKAGMTQRAKNGLWNGGTLIGYDVVDKMLKINDTEAEHVKKIFELYVYEDYGYGKICKYLNTREIKTKRNNTWAYSSVRGVLDNPTYAGYIRFNKHTNWAKNKRKGKSDNPILVKSTYHIPIITEELWQRTQEKRKQVGKPNKRIYKGEWLLSGLPKCPKCGSSMVAHRVRSKPSKKNPKGKMNRYYICSQYSNKDISVCKPNLIHADKAEKEVIKRLFEFIDNPNLIDIIINKYINKARPDKDKILIEIDRLEEKLRKHEKHEDSYYLILGDPDTPEELSTKKIMHSISIVRNKMLN